VVKNLERPLPVTVWYPAVNPQNKEESITYSVDLRWFPKPELAATVLGHALLDADPDASGAPYPLVVFSAGYAMYATYYATVIEHLASQGFVVIAPEHEETFYFEGESWKDIPMSSVERPQDVRRTLDYAESLTASGGVFEGLINMKQVAVAGHSYGGYTALAAAGARYDLLGFHQRCDVARAAGDPTVSESCDFLFPYEEKIAARAGLDPVPQGLWPYWGDPRVDAIIPMAGDAYMFDQRGLAEITVPVLAMVGTADLGMRDWGTRPTYEFVSSQQKVLVEFENAQHGIFGVDCEAVTWFEDLGVYGWCADPVWDMNRAHDLINHFTTAFLLDVLKGDKDAHAALAPDAVNFPGIQYKAQGF
jgi:predicted dienelactone hydrolase